MDGRDFLSIMVMLLLIFMAQILLLFTLRDVLIAVQSIANVVT